MWLSKRVVRAFICAEFSSKNVMLNFSRFSGGMGLSIRSSGGLVGGGGLAINVFGGIRNMTG